MKPYKRAPTHPLCIWQAQSVFGVLIWPSTFDCDFGIILESDPSTMGTMSCEWSTVAFISSISSGAASSNCHSMLLEWLLPLRSPPAWIAVTTRWYAWISWMGLSSVSAQHRSEARLQQEKAWPHRATPLGCPTLAACFIPKWVQALLVFKSLHRAMHEDLHDYSTETHSSMSRLQSLMKTDHHVHRIRTCCGDCALSAADPQCRNGLSPMIWLAGSVYSFKSKTYPICC